MKIQERVENILKASESARNSDKELLIIYMQKSGMNLSEDQKDAFRDMPSMETIRRSRQVIQERGNYLPNHKVTEERYKKYKEVKQNIKYESPEKLLEKQGYVIREWGQ